VSYRPLSYGVMLNTLKGKNIMQDIDAKKILNKIKLEIQQQSNKAKGFKSFKNFKNIIYLTTGKLDFSSINGEYNKILPKDLNYYFTEKII
jgi:hypothetical protein